jgi:hypothetical protein
MRLIRNLFSASAIAALAFATPALADAITFDSSDVGTAYTLNYNGFSDGSNVSGLTGQTTFTLTGISGNTYNFSYSVTNTSGAPVTDSRISSFAFNVDPEISSATATGAFAYTTLNGSYPNGIGSVDVCFKDANTGNCSGGGGGGLTIGSTGTGTFSLSFSEPVSSIVLSDFFLRYQSISGVSGVSSASGSGTLTGTTTTTTTSGGTTTTTTTTSSGGTEVPEPGMLGLLGGALIATALLRRRRRSEDELKAA